jgi:xanthine dehydrogenase accessory factor
VARVLVRGSGDIGSAVAHKLFTSGHAVVLHEEPQPSASRRDMAFTDAVFEGVARLEGVAARRLDELATIKDVLAEHNCILLSVAAFEAVLVATQPMVLVDARMRKRAHPETQRGLAALTIGLGPNFVAGGNVDIAIETSWEDLGRVIRDGATLPLVGEPRELGGHARDRRAIGERVEAGELVATIAGTPLLAPLTGVLRGLTHDGVPVVERTKVIEVDPRGEVGGVRGIGERPRRIADGVLAALDGGPTS